MMNLGSLLQLEVCSFSHPAKGSCVKSESRYKNRHTVQNKLGQTFRWVMASWCLRSLQRLVVPSSGSESLVRFVPSTHEASHLPPSPWMCPVCPQLEVHAGCWGSGDYEDTHHVTWVSAGSWRACDARNSWKTLGNKQTQIKTIFF